MYICVVNKLLLILFFIPLISYGQNNFSLGEWKEYRTNKNGNSIKINYKLPIPFESTSQSYAIDNTNLAASFLYNGNPSKATFIQIYCTSIPSQFNIDENQFFDDKKAIENIINQIVPAPINEIINYNIIKIGNQSYIEIYSITHDIQKQVNWVTIKNNYFINIVGTTLKDSFSSILPFLMEFKKFIKVE